MEPVFLTSRQLAEKYAVAGMNSEKAWYRRLSEWREDGRLIKGVHFKYTQRLERVYLEQGVLCIVVREKKDIFCDAVKIEHHLTIRTILSVPPAVPADAADKSA